MNYFNILIYFFFLYIYTVQAKNDTAQSDAKSAEAKKELEQQGTNIAQSAAQDAKKAEESMQQAGEKAAHEAKTHLADKAAQAAEAAQAALSGKEEVVQHLEEQLKEAEGEVNEDSANLQILRQTVEAAAVAAKHAQKELQLLQAALQLAKSKCCTCDRLVPNIQNIIQINSDVQKDLQIDSTQSKNEVATKGSGKLDAAKARVQKLNKDLVAAKSELSKTNDAAKKAAQSATAAKQSADSIT